MKYLHTMVRVTDLEQSLDFYCNKLGLVEVRRYENEKGRFTLVFLAAPGDEDRARSRDRRTVSRRQPPTTSCSEARRPSPGVTAESLGSSLNRI